MYLGLSYYEVRQSYSKVGTQYLNVDVDIEAGEEASSTDGIIELEQIEYAESETSVQLAEEDFMDVDVVLEDLKKDDKIEAILPISPNLKDISERISLAKVAEEKEKIAKEEKGDKKIF
ncbi:unnamed protein product [Meloidogyne enterolobii]|uniref:Uncharacterized protein n=1 Tax=Meloidogyne enterolobii TaxID=390850 RepID=A0ACB1AY06_MELEN